MFIFWSNLVVGSFSLRKMHNNKWAVLMVLLWNSLASKKVVLSARSAWRVRRKFFLSWTWATPSGLAGVSISTFRFKWSRSTSSWSRMEIAFPLPSLKIPKSRCSVPMKSCPRRSASSLLYDNTSLTRGEKLSSIALYWVLKILKLISIPAKSVPDLFTWQLCSFVDKFLIIDRHMTRQSLSLCLNWPIQ